MGDPALLSAIAQAGSEGAKQYAASQQAMQQDQASSVQAALGLAAAQSAPQGAGGELSSIIGAPYQAQATRSAANAGADQSYTNTLNTAQQGFNTAQRGIQAQTEAEVAAKLSAASGGGSGGGGGSRGGGGGGGSKSGEKTDWLTMVKEDAAAAGLPVEKYFDALANSPDNPFNGTPIGNLPTSIQGQMLAEKYYKVPKSFVSQIAPTSGVLQRGLKFINSQPTGAKNNEASYQAFKNYIKSQHLSPDAFWRAVNYLNAAAVKRFKPQNAQPDYIPSQQGAPAPSGGGSGVSIGY